MKKLFLSIGLALALSGFAQAQTPPEVLKPYKAYVAALKEGDVKATTEHALKAWQIAEKMLGDTKTTGDLAANYAGTTDYGKNPYKNYKKRIEAHNRSIKLAKFYSKEIVGEMEVERRLKLAELSLNLSQWKRGKFISGGKGTYFDEVEDALDKYGLRGSTFEADLEVLRTRFYELRKDNEKSLEHSEKALALYEKTNDGIITPYKYQVRLLRGNNLKSLNQPIPAALEYQTVMQSLEGKVASDNPFIKLAFTEWMRTRSELEDAGRLEEAEKAGLCRCWPYEDYENQILPLKRIPPIMPGSAQYSGHVNVIFDVDDNGKPYNIRDVNSTNSIFVKSALKCVKGWEYTKLGPDEDAETRKNIVSKISFKLTDTRGNLLPER